ncbi:MAG: hypothetical protein QM733_07355 [Ilumatobacteraceae bacterium]
MAWTACRVTYLTTLRSTILASDDPAPPAAADPLAFADCVATHGWLPTVGDAADRALPVGARHGGRHLSCLDARRDRAGVVLPADPLDPRRPDP